MKVTADFGVYNVGFEGGLSLYGKAFFQELISDQIRIDKSNAVVLYFEVDNLEELEKEMAEQGFEFIHKIKEQPWKQRDFRFYDYDNHILEIAEDGYCHSSITSRRQLTGDHIKTDGIPAGSSDA